MKRRGFPASIARALPLPVILKSYVIVSFPYLLPVCNFVLLNRGQICMNVCERREHGMKANSTASREKLNHMHQQSSYTCEFVSTDSWHFPEDTFQILIQQSFEPPPVASKLGRHGHHDTACVYMIKSVMVTSHKHTIQNVSVNMY